MAQERTLTRRGGFTLIELLIVIAVIGILLAILMPVLGQVVEATNKAQCASKLRDLGLAILAYHDAQGVYPLGMAYGTATRTDIDSKSSSWAMQSFLLPYLQEHRVYDLINFDVNVTKYEGLDINQTARMSRMSVYLCPSDPVANIHAAGNNYVGCIGPDYYIVKPLGMFGSLLKVSDKDVVDGLTHTIAMSERIIDWGVDGKATIGSCYYITGSPTFDVNKTDGDYDRIVGLETLLDRCNESKQHFWYYNGWQWGRGGLSWTLFNTLAPPNRTRNCRHGNDDVPWERGVLPPSSYHPGGVNVLMADGSVDFLADNIDINIFRAMGSRDKLDDLNPAYSLGVSHVPTP